MSKLRQYGILNIKNNLSELERHLENIKTRGFTALKQVLKRDEVKQLTTSLENIYKIQEEEFGRENLDKIAELDVARTLLYYDNNFVNLVRAPEISEIVKSVLGDNYILHLQNGIINRPKKVHHQSSWHRDIPYQEYILSSPISINVFYCMAPFNEQTGGTIFLPYSQKTEEFPSIDFVENNNIQPEADEGDVIIFDSWVYHKAGYNSSQITRYGINNVFTSPILKQQINLPKLLKGKYEDDKELNTILGYKFQVADSVLDFRKRRIEKINLGS